MELRFTFAHTEGNVNHWVKPLDLERPKVCRSLKCQSIEARWQVIARKQLTATSVGIGVGRLHQSPLPRSVLAFQMHRDAARRFAATYIQNVGRNAFHCESHFFKRMFVILRCSSADSCNSMASSFRNRNLKISNISVADLPVAHTINTRPNRCSYSTLLRARAA